MDNGWISLHRKFLDWGWYDDMNTKSLFIHCLLKANHTEKNWRGKNIERGQFFTSVKHLSFELKLTPKKIRLALSKLEQTGEIVQKGASNGTMITVCKYDSYQDTQKQEGKQRANKGQTKGKQRATTNNNNKDNKDNNKTMPDENFENQFVKVWNLYGKKTDLIDAKNEYYNLTEKEKKIIIDHIPKFIKNHFENNKVKYIPKFVNYLLKKKWNEDFPYSKKVNGNQQSFEETKYKNLANE